MINSEILLGELLKDINSKSCHYYTYVLPDAVYTALHDRLFECHSSVYTIALIMHEFYAKCTEYHSCTTDLVEKYYLKDDHVYIIEKMMNIYFHHLSNDMFGSPLIYFNCYL